MFSVEGKQDFFDCTVRGAVQKLRHQCATVIIHKTMEYDVTINSEQSFIVDEKFEITTKHPQNKIESKLEQEIKNRIEILRNH